MLKGTPLEGEGKADQQDQRAQAGSGWTELQGSCLEAWWIRAGFPEKVKLPGRIGEMKKKGLGTPPTQTKT